MENVKFTRLALQPTPSSILTLPFNRLTIMYTSKPSDVTSTTIHNYLNKMLNRKTKSKDPGYDIKVHRLRVWCISGNSLSVEAKTLYNNYRTGEILVSHPGRNQWARIGVEWPKAQQNRVFPSAGPLVNYAFIYSNNARAKILYMLDISWRPQKKFKALAGCCDALRSHEDSDEESSGFELLDYSSSEDVVNDCA